MPDSFACPAPGCPARFQKRRGLNKHEASCTYFWAEEERKQARRAARAKAEEEALQEKHKRRLLQADLAAMGMSTPLVPTEQPAVVDTSPAPEDTPMPDASDLTADPTVLTNSTASLPTSSANSARTAARHRRKHRRPARHPDVGVELPRSPPDVPDEPSSTDVPPELTSHGSDSDNHFETASTRHASGVLPRVRLLVRDSFTSAINSFGLFRRYWHRPSYDPDAFLSAKELAAHPPVASQEDGIVAESSDEYAPSWPSSNITIYRIMSWANNGHPMKSDEQIDAMVTSVINAPGFDPYHLDNFNSARENARLTRAIAEAQNVDNAPAFLRQYTPDTVTIDVPTGRASQSVPYEIPGLLRTSLTRIIKAAFEDSLAQHLHYTPFELRHSATGNANDSQRVFGELYTSPAFLEAHNDVQRHGLLPPDDPNCKRERLVIALQLASDATHLADFGAAKAWPIYVMLGNISKYIRAMPTSGALHHLAYIPPFPPSFAAFGEANHSKWKTQHQDVLKHCHRELMHAVWSKILDNDFISAYKYGTVVRCLDGVKRRVYPRIFTYSADYPEKYVSVLLATIRDGGLCPCPRCLVEKSKLDRLGLRRDMTTRLAKARRVFTDYVIWARNAIYRFAHPIGGKVMEMILKPYSAVPTVVSSTYDRLEDCTNKRRPQNAFSDKLGPQFNPSDMLVVDLMHEFELGVWKAIFTHLIRILYAADPHGKLVTELNERWCALPCFDGLVEDDPFNRKLQRLLYRTAEWHATAKLRMHTDATLKLLDELTREFGALAREFEQLSAAQFATVETPKEATARARREMNKNTAAAGQPKPSADDVAKAPKSRKPKRLNLSTYKFHSLGDYSSTIRRYGTTDSYTTQTSELAHRVVKRLYELTNKKDAMQQVADKNARSEFFREMEKHERQELANTPPDKPYSIAKTRNERFDMRAFIAEHHDDPACNRFVDNLKDHLLGRRLHREFDGDDYDFNEEDRLTIQLKDDRIYSSQSLRTNYTTYDVRRDYDCISARRREFLMTRSPEEADDAHPYWYAQLLGVFRADVRHTGRLSEDLGYRQMDFLWVIAGGDGSHISPRSDTSKRRNQTLRVGFLDPALVVRGAHLIPSFTNGRGVPYGQEDDWINYYANMYVEEVFRLFVDRDMFMRHLGGGIGHLSPSRPFGSTNSADADHPEDEGEDVAGSALEEDPSRFDGAEDGEDDVCDNAEELLGLEEDGEDVDEGDNSLGKTGTQWHISRKVTAARELACFDIIMQREVFAREAEARVPRAGLTDYLEGATLAPRWRAARTRGPVDGLPA
ncbi:hypothetical protein EV715DRAFT_267796 [Schizophyllum commune]